MDTYHKIQTLFKRDMDGSITGKKGKMIRGAWTTPELEYLAGNQWEFTEKVDGTNIRVRLRFDGDEWFTSYAGRTNNAQIPEPLARHLNDAFTDKSLRASGLSGEIVLYGEGYGTKIQGGGKYREDHSFVLFDVKIGDYWLDRENVNDIARNLGIDSVPVLGRGTLLDAIDIVSTGITFDDRGGVRRWGRNGLNSQWGEFEAEGIVARPVVPLFNRKGERIITKIKAVDFK